MLHIVAHFIIPAIVAWLFFNRNWKIAYLLMIATMLVDLDHLLSNPIYDPMRCSIGFHPLHGAIAIMLYMGLTAFSKTRIIGVGLIIHMMLDSLDCQINNGIWFNGYF